MSRIDFESGRKNQKLRTRQALLSAAQQLMEQGKEPTIDEVAELALVSRATAYRYFPNAERLILEASLESVLDIDSMDSFASEDPAERVVQVQSWLYDHAKENEVQFRLFLSNANREWVETDGKSELRGGRRLSVIEKALTPINDELNDETHAKLVNALAGMMGIESLTMLRDICDLSHEEAKLTMSWAVRTLVNAVLNH